MSEWKAIHELEEKESPSDADNTMLAGLKNKFNLVLFLALLITGRVNERVGPKNTDHTQLSCSQKEKHYFTFSCFFLLPELHFRNHIDPVCRRKYNPSVVKEKYPGVRFMSAEQTFAWLSRFRKILSAMLKIHYLFTCIDW